MKKLVSCILGVFMIGAVFTGCSQADDNTQTQAEATKQVKIGYVNWADSIAMTNLATAILEEKMGYDVDLVLADVAPVFTSVASGNTDLFLSTWLPVTHGEYLEKYGADIVDLGATYEGALIGLIVPSYVEANSIEELNDYKDAFDGKIIGIDAGAGIMSATENAIEEYGLDYGLINGSGPAMTAALAKAIDDNEAIVVTGWAPHWKFGRFDLKILEDPKGIYGAAESIHTYSRKGFEEDMPEVATFFKNFKLTDEVLANLLGDIEDSDEDPLVVTKEWVNNNEDLVNTWLEGIN
jgi:glycine betaine/proline transport system substrate-binding protein